MRPPVGDGSPVPLPTVTVGTALLCISSGSQIRDLGRHLSAVRPVPSVPPVAAAIGRHRTRRRDGGREFFAALRMTKPKCSRRRGAQCASARRGRVPRPAALCDCRGGTLPSASSRLSHPYREDRKSFECWPSSKTIGAALCMSKNTVLKYVHRLEEKITS